MPEVDLARLPAMPLAELSTLWRRYFRKGKSAQPPLRRLMVRELAYRVQELGAPGGGIDAATRKLLAAAMRAAMSSRGAREAEVIETDAAEPVPAKRAAPRPSTMQTLAAESRLVRTWRGRTYEVTVVEHGKAFCYRDRTYASLTQIAREITGTNWSGPRFFGLTNRRGQRTELQEPER